MPVKQLWVKSVPLRRAMMPREQHMMGDWKNLKVGDSVWTGMTRADADGEWTVALTRAMAETGINRVYVDAAQLSETRAPVIEATSLEPVAERVTETVTLTREVVNLKLSDEEAVAVAYVLVRALGETEMARACRRVLEALVASGVEVPPQSAGLSEGTVLFE